MDWDLEIRYRLVDRGDTFECEAFVLGFGFTVAMGRTEARRRYASVHDASPTEYQNRAFAFLKTEARKGLLEGLKKEGLA